MPIPASGVMIAAAAQPIVARHCHVIFLHGDFSGAASSDMSVQSIPTDACAEREEGAVGAIAIAIDWP